MFEGPYLAGCLLLIAAGTAKVLHPGDTARALRRLSGERITTKTALYGVRLVAGLETILGAGGAAMPGKLPAILVAASYLGFTAIVAVARARHGPLATCGCFGRPDTPPTVSHLVITAGIALAAASMAASPRAVSTPLWASVARQPSHGALLIVLALGIAWTCWMAMTSLATLRGER
ncbi:MAG: MauE/DoxX family redox-associated membrane protein [Acidimicrobiales bacterium]